MTQEYLELRESLVAIGESMANYAGTVNRSFDAVTVQVEKLWQDNANLRDELYALSNRVEALTRANLRSVGDDAA